MCEQCVETTRRSRITSAWYPGSPISLRLMGLRDWLSGCRRRRVALHPEQTDWGRHGCRAFQTCPCHESATRAAKLQKRRWTSALAPR
jgi:hypothetical protein